MDANKTQSLFTQKTPKVRKKQFFKITMALAIVIVLILLYKTFASTGVGTASNISLNYDTNTIKQSNGKIECIKDDRILQWHEGKEMWECKKPTDTVFGELDKNNVKVNDSGNLECKEDNKALIWEDNQWACGDAGSNITTEDGLSINSNDQLSIDSPTCSSTEKLLWDGNNFQCQEDQNEDEQTLSFTDNVLAILNGNDIDLTDLDNSEDLENHIDNSPIHFSEGSIDHGNIAGLSDDDHTQYALLNGRSGGQTISGGTGVAETLKLQSTSNPAKGKIFFGTKSVYSQFGNRLGLNTTNPTNTLTMSYPSTATLSDSNNYVLVGDGLDDLALNFYNPDNSGSFSGMVFRTRTTGASVWLLVNEWQNTYIGDLIFRNRNAGPTSAERMRIKGSNGFVGINTNNPSAMLHAKGSTSDSSAYALKVDDSSDSNLLSVRNDGRLSGEQIETNKSGSVYLGNTNGINTDDGTSNRNIGIGEGSLNSVTTGYNNTAIGWKVMQNMTTGEDGGGNIGIGREVLSVGNNFESCIGIGKGALKNNISGDHNIAIGYSALQGDLIEGGASNIAIGDESLYSNISGESNTAMQTYALRSLQSGDGNLAIGHSTLYDLVSGNGNVAIASFALQNSLGTQNTSVGYASSNALINGDNNTNLGAYSGFYQTDGSSNVMIGYGSGLYYGSGTAQLTTSNNSIFIGQTARAGADSSSNEIVIGYDALGHGLNTATIGDDNITDTYLKGNSHTTGSMQVADDTATCDATKVGTLKYYSDSNNSYVDMCVQDGASSYVWRTINQETW